MVAGGGKGAIPQHTQAPIPRTSATSPRSPCCLYSSLSRALLTPVASVRATATVAPPTPISPPGSCSGVILPVQRYRAEMTSEG